METDESPVALGAVLKQMFKDTRLIHFVGFVSRVCSKSERNYAALELELFAVLRAVEHFQMFSLSREFLLQTDHADFRNFFQQDLLPTIRVDR